MENVLPTIMFALSLFFGDNVNTMTTSFETQNMCIEPSMYSICNFNESYREAATEIILEEMIVWTDSEGNRTYATSCRNQQNGCEAHIRKVVDIIFKISCENNFDPFMVLAIAKHESNFNPFILHKRTRATGLLQLMPNSPFAKGIRFIHNSNYRNQCRNHETYCQEEIIYASLRLLYRSIARCGTLSEGLGLYGSGSCHGSREFSRFVRTYGPNLRQKSLIMRERNLDGSTNN